MSTVFATGIGKGDDGYEVAKRAVSDAQTKLGDRSVSLALVFCSSQYDYHRVIAGVREATDSAPLLGCSTAGEFSDERVMAGSIVVGLLASDETRFYLATQTGLAADPLGAVQRAVNALPKHVDGFPHLSAVVLHDGLSGKGEETVLSASVAFGAEITFVGGAAADDLRWQSTSVFANDRVLADAVVLCLMATKKPIITGVRHGHTPLSEEMTITRAADNVVYEVDGRPAWDVWKDRTAAAARELGIDVTRLEDDAEIGSLFLRFELGLLTEAEQYKVRIPLRKNDDGSINFGCTIPEGAKFRIMRSPKQAQIESAREAVRHAMDQAQGTDVAGAVVFDCSCRGLILGDEFSSAVNAMRSEMPGVPFIGFETYGEICMNADEFSGFHNTTSVVMLIPA